MKAPSRPVQLIATILLILAVAGANVFYSPYAERKLAEGAVANVAGGAAMTKMVKAPSGGRRSTLWCAIIDRDEGLVAVRTRSSRLPFMEEVVEVAPYWVGLQTPYEYRMLETCREVLSSGPSALP